MTQPNAEVTVPELWAGVDAGKTEHHSVVIDGEGRRLLSRRVTNDETVLLELIGEVAALAADGPVTWAVDLNAGGAALLIALLVNHDQRLSVRKRKRVIAHAAPSIAPWLCMTAS